MLTVFRAVLFITVLLISQSGQAFDLSESDSFIDQQEELYASYDPLKTKLGTDTLIFTDLGSSLLIRLKYDGRNLQITPVISSTDAYGFLSIFTKDLFSR